ncbi:DNA repair protein RecO [Chlorogloeopsis sp. ULAP01]|uniref:DNA repair protein RecO n=1 Tax=Chlorogloeopsis sp. ULAP01 TaxID=3056483 RepID=UPI0025AA786D|nr:DNA repair protein RecO [Chlorogloeopsis sp. ULAP01]MDM9379273.1 DNA repair protein RecO [Chlorogloeopsis sp. ULAP01]
MSKTYKATGINLRTQVFGESDKIVTILTKEYGLIRAIAPGARKHNSSLGGRSAMFVVNDLLIAKGRSLDKITQAQTVKSYSGLAKDLGRLAASQYLAEVVLCQGLSEQPQEELYELINEHLRRLEVLSSQKTPSVMALLAHGLFQLLALAGFTPEVHMCCLTQRPLIPDFTDPNWQVGFSINAGGIVCLTAWERLRKEDTGTRGHPDTGKGNEEDTGNMNKRFSASPRHPLSASSQTASPSPSTRNLDYETIFHRQEMPALSKRLNARELTILQHLSQSEIMQDTTQDCSWLSVEQVLRQYAQYHFGRPIRSAALIDSYFAANHDASL